MAYDVQKTDEQWREELTPEEYAVLRQAGTERPFTGEYEDTTTEGVYACAYTIAERAEPPDELFALLGGVGRQIPREPPGGLLVRRRGGLEPRGGLTVQPAVASSSSARSSRVWSTTARKLVPSASSWRRPRNGAGR